ncbi:TIGR00245 family protein [Xenococcus sp. PCC 7305]|uniref:ABC transporter permease n=1 Tax=Xenococcus sp. PCC 7305 TaxID=102125 RepID=UPI0002ACAC90|nr:iron export ABC transporter permease subunit FetB [Xenococcus sp. PCC 7305]ELS04023.1 TIGR00245 family protein [Xenococcus sp. PCC 7305]
MNNVIELDVIDLALALGLIGMAIALSLWQKLGLESQFFFGAGRALLQLLVVGYVLDLVFALNHPIAVLMVIFFMLSVAAITARNRIDQQRKGLLPLVWLSLIASTGLSVAYIIVAIVQPPVWYEPQYLIPLTGMLLGNAMNGASLAGDRLINSLKQNQREIETHLCLGATPKQAIFDYQKEAMRTGLIPTLNTMMVVGLVTLPGMFTGQVLAGTDPLNAASYQILILFAIVFTNLIATFLITESLYRKFFNKNLQLII